MSSHDFASVKKLIEDDGIRFIDLKMLDLSGRLHHLSFPSERLTESVCRNGIGFDEEEAEKMLVGLGVNK